MKYLYWLMAILTLMFILPVITKYKTGDTINAVSMKTADQSLMVISKHMQAEQSVVFKTAYGLLKEIRMEEGGEDAFLSTVKGLNPQDVIDLARQEVNARIAKGDGKFAGYRDWDDLIAKTTKPKEAKKHP